MGSITSQRSGRCWCENERSREWLFSVFSQRSIWFTPKNRCGAHVSHGAWEPWTRWHLHLLSSHPLALSPLLPLGGHPSAQPVSCTEDERLQNMSRLSCYKRPKPSGCVWRHLFFHSFTHLTNTPWGPSHFQVASLLRVRRPQTHLLRPAGSLSQCFCSRRFWS